MADRDRQDFGGAGASRASAGARSNTSGTGAYNGQGRPNTIAAALAGPTGLRGPLGPTGEAGHTTAALGVGSPFQGAVADYGANYLGDPASRAVKAFTGVGLQRPNPNRPTTFANGLSHTGVDPLGVALGAAGAAVGVPVGAIYGLGKQITGWDGPEVTVGNASPGIPGPGQGFDYSGAGPQGRFGQGTGQAGAAALGNPTGGGGMAAFPNPVATAPGGAPFGAQPGPTVGAQAPNPMAAFFNPKIPNHSLPQGYQSLFPNSLSDADKALLYGQKLMGGA